MELLPLLKCTPPPALPPTRPQRPNPATRTSARSAEWRPEWFAAEFIDLRPPILEIHWLTAAESWVPDVLKGFWSAMVKRKARRLRRDWVPSQLSRSAHSKNTSVRCEARIFTFESRGLTLVPMLLKNSLLASRIFFQTWFFGVPKRFLKKNLWVV